MIVSVLWLFPTVHWVSLQCVFEVLSDHIDLIFCSVVHFNFI